MDIIYFFFILTLVILVTFLWYIKSILNLKKENSILKAQIENQKCDNFNSIANEAQTKQKENTLKKYKIIDFLTKHETITNDQVENLLKISNSTAYRLLEELEKEKKILQIGNTGKNVYYILNRYKK